MKSVQIDSVPGFEEWRLKARQRLFDRTPPNQIVWNTDSRPAGLFDTYQSGDAKAPSAFKQPTVPKAFLPIAEAAACHKSADRYNLLYRILWRLNHEDKNLLKRITDDDIVELNALVKAVRHDAYKITAFLRFREIKIEGEEYFVSWYEPEHYTLERVLPFFRTRFRNMRWSILTPYRAAHWNGADMILEDNPDPSLYPKEDEIERYWLGYYASIFNPARLKKSAMLAQMPKKYWKNMPETVLINDMVRGASTRTERMIDKSKT